MRKRFLSFLLCSLMTGSSALALEENLNFANFNPDGLPKEIQEEILKQFPKWKERTPTLAELDQLIRLLIQNWNYNHVSIDKDNGTYSLKISKVRTVRALTFKGHTAFSEAELRREFALVEKSSFDQQKAIDAANHLRLLYAEKGFYKTVIDLEFEQDPNQDPNIRVVIHEGPQTLISSVQIESANKELERKLWSLLRRHEGDPLREVTLSEMRQKMRDYLSRNKFLRAEILGPEVGKNKEETQATIFFKVEKSEKYDLIYDGDSRISEDDIEDALELDRFSSTNPSIADELASKIKAFYISQGYARAEVQATETSEGTKSFTQRVIFNIAEGPRVRIKNIDFTGKLSLPPSEYADFLRKNSSPLVKKGYFIKDDIDQGLKNLVIDRQNQGYLKAREISKRSIYNKEKNQVTITVNFDEGPLTVLQAIQFSGQTAFSPAELIQVMDLRTDQPLKLNQLEESLVKLKDFYRNSGYLEMIILNEKEDLVLYNEDNTQAKLNLKIYEGPKIIVGTIVIEGNSISKNIVIQRELEFQVGDTLTPAKIEESIRRLQKLGHFSSIDIKTAEEKTQVSQRTVVVRVTDRDPGLFNFGFGATNERLLTLRGYTGVAYRNIQGTGRGVSLRLDGNYNETQIKFLERKITMGYLEPSLFDSRVKGRVNLTRALSIRDYISQWDEPIAEELNQLTYTVEQDITSNILFSYDILNVATVKNFSIRTNNPEGPVSPAKLVNIASTGPTLDIDFRDNPFAPNRGTFTRFNLEYGSPGLGSNDTIEYGRALGSFTHYLTVGKPGWVWTNSLRGGYLKNLSDRPNGGVPYDKKGLILGGQSSLRGFQPTEAFPNQYDLRDENGSRVAIDNFLLKTDASMYLVKTELRFPVYGNFGGAIFYDGGAVFIKGLGFDDPYRDAVGVAFRYATPVGAVSLEWAWKLDRKSDRDESQLPFTFSIGTF